MVSVFKFILKIESIKKFCQLPGNIFSPFHRQVIITGQDENGTLYHNSVTTEKGENNNNNILTKADANISQKEKEKGKDDLPKSLESLVEKCGEKLLNPDFLLQGGGQPFTSEDGEKSNEKEEKKVKENAGKSPIQDSPKLAEDKNSPQHTWAKEKDGKNAGEDVKEKKEAVEQQPKRPTITLYSQKMKGLKDLLLAEKLNTNAISLQITAQSQVQVGGKKSRLSSSSGAGGNESETSARSKRARRE
jgi:menin